MISAINLRKNYKSKTALNIEKLEIKRGTFTGLVGNNGAGKTTFLSLILDLIKPTEGEVFITGERVSKNEGWKKFTASYLDARFLIPFLTPLEFLTYIGSLNGKNNADLQAFIKENINFYADDIFSGKYIRELSTGNKQKVGILSTFLPDPDLIILDEPFSSLDPTSQSWLKIKLRKLHSEGKTILISSHDLKHVTDICKRIILLEKGQVQTDIAVNKETLARLEDHFMVHE